MNSKNKSSALCPKIRPNNRTCYAHKVRRTVTVTVQVNKWEALALLHGARDNLGRVVAQYDGLETFQFLIDDAKADVTKWQSVRDSFD